MDTVAEGVDEGNIGLFNKKLHKLLNKTRLQDGVCDLRQSLARADLGYRSHFQFSLPHVTAGRDRQGRQVGERR